MHRFFVPARLQAFVASIFLFGIALLMNACVPDFLVPDADWVVIEPGDHEPLPKRKVGILFSPGEVSATVTFDSSCIYDVGAIDEQDWNKVIGLGFVGSKDQDITTGIPPHQIDGARVGWRWNPQRGRIDLGAYVYVEGKLTSFKIAETALNTPTKLTIKIDYNKKLYQILGGQPVPFTHNKTFAYKTGLYFGGNQTAPHQIRVKIVE
ncbi:hypothetical protein HNV11_01835 [Spirosoma taeanense]|uniref:Uncharacterized protein n=1 Tax=Spirosoma taeanense TaxID=2735870 RepID=A0A6M5Y4C4_9BACT|nr:hypothetical protein [Spirosoma taeanense]QJW88210.1 hypothetical protein HNV11_01835 [Spirosoma taeanense]